MIVFNHWSPAQLMTATGYRLDLVSNGGQQRVAWAISPRGKRHHIGANAAERAHRLFSRLARMALVDPDCPPFSPLALINGQPQDPNRRGFPL